jgi:hypothetical protein
MACIGKKIVYGYVGRWIAGQLFEPGTSSKGNTPLDRDVRYSFDDKHFLEIGCEYGEHSMQLVVAMTLTPHVSPKATHHDTCCSTYTAQKRGGKKKALSIAEYADATEIIIMDFKYKGLGEHRESLLISAVSTPTGHTFNS